MTRAYGKAAFVGREREYKAEWMRDYRRNDPRRPLLTSAKARARDKGLPCTISLDDIVIPAVCPVLGIPIRPNSGRHDANSPTLDRIHGSLGYTPNNVRVISYRANNLKSDMTLIEARLILKDLEERL